jgi:electron transfer flavoprotein alpha subunit
MNRRGEIWVFAEEERGKLSDGAVELLGKAAELARASGAVVAAVLLGGRGTEDLASRLGAFGADKVYLVEDAKLRHYQTTAYRKVVCDLCRNHEPRMVLFGATAIGDDLAPSVASALESGFVTDCTDLRIVDAGPGKGAARTGVGEKGDTLIHTRPAYGGAVVESVVNRGPFPRIATVREGVFVAPSPDAHRRFDLVRENAGLEELALPLSLIETHRAPRTTEFVDARVIVAGGAGVGTKENFKLIWALANCLGGAVGATRAAVDLGFADGRYQIGQTGAAVSPALYVACGISGAAQHKAGMDEAERILAINIDPQAPIFSYAHYGIVGDLVDVIPRLIETIRRGARSAGAITDNESTVR